MVADDERIDKKLKMIKVSGYNVSSYFAGGAEESQQHGGRDTITGEENQGNVLQYQLHPSLIEEVLHAHKGIITLQTKKNSATGLDRPYDIEYNFTSRSPVSFQWYFICGATYHFSKVGYPVGINSKVERRLSFNEIWDHKSHTKKRSKEGIYVSIF